ncbi:MAG: hypothetical protein JWR77_212 [Rhizorhabdus sp.]|nr:hypothetical protein [Rhizorhabdus sp.]
MTVRLDAGTIRLEGDIAVGDAESLLACLHTDPASTVDLSGCGTIHSAAIQILLAARPSLFGTPADSFVAKWILRCDRM